MTDFERELLQARHRLEEAQARNRAIERKARTRRLIQEGAILEKALPQTTQMTLEQLETFLCEVFKAVSTPLPMLSIRVAFVHTHHLIQ